MDFKKRKATKYTTQTPAIEYNDGANWVALASQDFVNAKQITLTGAVTGVASLGGSLNTSLASSQELNSNSLTFNWSNVLSGLYQLTHSLAESSSDYFLQEVKMGSGSTYRGWRQTFLPGSSSSATGSFSLQFWHAATSSYLTPFSITSSGDVFTSRFSTDVDLGSKKITSLANGFSSSDAINKSQLDTKIWDINSSTTGSLAINRLAGYPASSSTFLRGDGAWATVTVGTVTSVACTGSTGLTISGSPIITSGTIGLTLGSELQALSGLNTLGIVCRTAANTYVPRNIAVGTGLSVTNPAGTEGNPTISLGTIPIANLTGYPTSSSSFLRGDGVWSQISLSTNVTGTLPIAKLSGYPSNAAIYLNGNGSWTTPAINNLGITGDISLGGYSLTNANNIYCSTLRGRNNIEFSLGDHMILGTNRIYGISGGSYFYVGSSGAGNGTFLFASNSVTGVFKSYGYLNASGATGTATGTNAYSIYCDLRVAATEFNATSSKKIKKIDNKLIDLVLLRETFLKIPFRSYEYLDPSDGKGKNFGVIAEELAQYFPQFVETEHRRYVPNCLQKISLRLVEGRKYTFVHDFDMGKIDPLAQKIKIVFGDISVDAKILQLTPGLLEIEIEKADKAAVMQELEKDHFFAYGTYEKCPTITKNKLFEVGLILLQDLLSNANIKNTNNMNN